MNINVFNLMSELMKRVIYHGLSHVNINADWVVIFLIIHRKSSVECRCECKELIEHAISPSD